MEDSEGVLDAQLAIIADTAGTGAAETVRRMTEELGLGTSQIAQIVRDYSKAIADGINPILVSIGGRPVVLGAHRGQNYDAHLSNRQADGSVLEAYACGGFREDHITEIAPAGAWRVWAEPETGGEAYIPLHPSKRSRSLSIWHEKGRRLGAFADDPAVVAMASGGFCTAEDVPAPAAA